MLINLFYHNTQARKGDIVVTDMTGKSSNGQGTPAASRLTGKPHAWIRCRAQKGSENGHWWEESSRKGDMRTDWTPVAKPRENLPVQNGTSHPVLVTSAVFFKAWNCSMIKKGIQRDINCPYPKFFDTIHKGTSALQSKLCLQITENVYHGDSSTDRNHFIFLSRSTNSVHLVPQEGGTAPWPVISMYHQGRF